MSFSNDKEGQWDSVKRYKLNKMINKLTFNMSFSKLITQYNTIKILYNLLSKTL